MSRVGPAALLLFAALCSARAAAHQPGLSQAEVRVHAAAVDAHLVFARAEVAALVPGADADRDGLLGEFELLSIETLLSEQVLQGIQVRADDRRCAGEVARIAFVEEDGLALDLRFTCPAPARALDLPLLARLPAGHRMVGRLRLDDSPDPVDFVAHRRRARIPLRAPERSAAPQPAELAPPDPAPPDPARASAGARSPWVWLGVALLATFAGVFRRRLLRAYSRSP